MFCYPPVLLEGGLVVLSVCCPPHTARRRDKGIILLVKTHEDILLDDLVLLRWVSDHVREDLEANGR